MAVTPVHPPYSIATLATKLKLEGLLGIQYETDAYTGMVYEEIRQALVEMQGEAWDWRLRSELVSVNTTGVALAQEDGFDTPFSQILTYAVDGGHRAAPWCSWDELASRIARGSSGFTVKHSSTTSNPYGQWMIYGNLPGATSNVVTFSYLCRVTPADDTTAVLIPMGWHELWYMLARARVTENVLRNAERGQLARATYEAAAEHLRRNHLLPDSKVRMGAGPSEATDNIPGTVADQLLNEMHRLGVEVSFGLCERAARRGFRESLNAIDWPFLVTSASQSLSSDLPADFAPSWDKTAAFLSGVKVPLLRPADYAKRASRPGIAGDANAWTIGYNDSTKRYKGISSTSGTATIIYRKQIAYETTLTTAADLPADFYDIWYRRARMLCLEMHAPEPGSAGAAALENAKSSWTEIVAQYKAMMGEPESGLDVSTDFDQIAQADDLVEQLVTSLEQMGVNASRGECRNAVRRGWSEAWRSVDQHRTKQLFLTSTGTQHTLSSYGDVEALLPGCPLTDGNTKTFRQVTLAQYQNMLTASTGYIYTLIWNATAKQYYLLTKPAVQSAGEAASLSTFYYAAPPVLTFGSESLVSCPDTVKLLWYLAARKQAFASHATNGAVTAARDSAIAEYDKQVARLRAEETGDDAGYGDSTLANLEPEIADSIRHLCTHYSNGAVKQAILEAYRDVWNLKEWTFRIAEATLTASAGNGTAALPADFDSLDMHMPIMGRNAEGTLIGLRVTDVFKVRQSVYLADSDNQAQPETVAIDYDSVTKTYVARFNSLSDGTYTWTFRYYRRAPALTTTIDVPDDFLSAVRKLAKLKALRRMALSADGRMALEDAMRDWTEERRNLIPKDRPELDTEHTVDVYGDMVHTQICGYGEL